jgi:glutamyl-tRNA(Gln) amidotransferase subunit E
VLANYGITDEEVKALRSAVGTADEDAVVFVADTAENTHDALKAVVERAQVACQCIPQETRTAKDDGTTRFMRPRPGAARMYPETDIPPQPLTEKLIEEVKAHLPEPAEKKLARLIKQYNLNEKLAKQLLDSEYLPVFEDVAKLPGVQASTVAAFLTETVKALQRGGSTPTMSPKSRLWLSLGLWARVNLQKKPLLMSSAGWLKTKEKPLRMQLRRWV